ncbi:MAG: hypothetical protein MUO68_06475 [Desulfobacteraceae bacterium]|nr:hypothetical protein [Desulfobacteraceae bacterium]
MDKASRKERVQDQRCPYCGADRLDLSYDNVEIDDKEEFQEVNCMICEGQFIEVYYFHRVILTDISDDDFRIVLAGLPH